MQYPLLHFKPNWVWEKVQLFKRFYVKEKKRVKHVIAPQRLKKICVWNTEILHNHAEEMVYDSNLCFLQIAGTLIDAGTFQSVTQDWDMNWSSNES